MAPARPYEARILQELRALPEEALPKVLRLITLVREEFFTSETREQQQILPRMVLGRYSGATLTTDAGS
jgi:hypothetical protein